MAQRTPKSKKSKKVFVIDTSVLLYSGESLFSFDAEEVVLPMSVLDELDTFKSKQDERGRNARFVIRTLRDMGKDGELSSGVKMPSGTILRVQSYANESIPSEVTNDITDNRILGLCKYIQSLGKVVALITKDISLSVKAQVLGIEAEDYFDDRRQNRDDEQYSGVATISIPDADVSQLFQQGACMTSCDLFPNQFVIARSDANPQKSALAKFSGGALLRVSSKYAWGLKPRNTEQTFSMDMLLDDSISLVTMSGVAGSGKTLLAIAAGLQKVIEEREYESLIITRPTIAVGSGELGFLPGTIDEKYEPWIRPIKDAISVLFSSRSSAAADSKFDEFVASGIIRIEPLTYIRGRTFHKNYMICDESQNMSRHEIKTFLTRCGDNTKVVMTGDTQQIDCPTLDSVSNGLTQVVEKFKTVDFAGHVTLLKGERSRLASAAAKLL